jgi:rRNA maturation protein Nop10
MARRLCPNMNHRRRDSPVAFCPDCGEVVNVEIPRRSCKEDSHVKQRRGRSHHCVDCGEQLIRER